MALNFKDTAGKAVKNQHEAYAYKDGENTLRMFGGILPKYVYWLKGANNKDIPVECLAFDRESEKFNNKEHDYVPEYFPDAKCSWSYSVNCIANGKVVVLNLKKKLFEQIRSAASDLGLDPTDPDTGFDIVFKKTKTGSMAFNVEYTLSQLKLKQRPLNVEERELVATAVSIDEKLPRPSAADVKSLLERITKRSTEDTNDNNIDTSEQEAINELG